MKYVLTSNEIKNWDIYTINHTSITSIQLMEQAAQQCTEWIIKTWSNKTSFAIFCGNGNNGGDGLAIARQLLKNQYDVKVYIDECENRSIDNKKNLHELEYLFPSCIHSINSPFIVVENEIIIDAIFGIGLNKAIEGKEKNWILKLNELSNYKLSIDSPSGLCADYNLRSGIILKATTTLSFQCFKKTFLFVETGQYCGQIEILDIGLSRSYLNQIQLNKIIITKNLLSSLLPQRALFAHKGNYGHSLLFVGSSGKMGAAILASKACLRSGTGLLSVLIPKSENTIIQNSVPEAMSITYSNNFSITTLDSYQSIGIGSGLGQDDVAKNILLQLLSITKIPLILDADAINIIAQNPELLLQVPQGSLITPHVKEFDRLFGNSYDAYQRYELQKQKSKELGITILLKGKYTSITTPGGISYFNITGNAGLAKGGTGDLLTGIIVGLNAQLKDIVKAAIIGVYIHGKAADIAISKNQSEESLLATDVIEKIGLSFKSIK